MFCPPKSSGMMLLHDSRRKLCRAGRRGHTATGPWVIPLSDVNGWVKVRDNTGITVAAGVVAGAWKRSSKCFKNRSEGEWPE